VLPLIAVPTTAGTGSEVARGAIIIVDDGRKLGFHSWHLMPKTAICDPELTLGLPPLLTAATGMDAIAHCMETFMAAPVNPPADGIALDGLARGWAHIERPPAMASDRDSALEHDERQHAGRDGLPEGPGLRAQPEPQPGRRESAPAPRHAQRHVPAGRDPLQRAGRVDAERAPPGRAWPMPWAWPGAAMPRHHGRRHPRAERPPGPAQGLAADGRRPRTCSSAVIDGAMADHCHKTNPRLASAEEYRGMLRESL
jgi:4-hydroxybutyrate dehydrogenase